MGNYSNRKGIAADVAKSYTGLYMNTTLRAIGSKRKDFQPINWIQLPNGKSYMLIKPEDISFMAIKWQESDLKDCLVILSDNE